MPKNPINSITPDTPAEVSSSREISRAVDLFTPAPEMVRLKSTFYTRWQPGPFAATEPPRLVDILEVTNSAQVEKWWSKPGFKEWFRNQDETREKVNYLASRALVVAEEMLESPETSTRERFALVKLLLEMGGLSGRAAVEQVKFEDEDVNKMSAEQLRSYLENRGISASIQKVINVAPNPEKSEEDARGEEDFRIGGEEESRTPGSSSD